MNARFAVVVTVACAAAAAASVAAFHASRGKSVAVAVPVEKPMPADGGVSVALPVNYTSMSLDFAGGPSEYFGSMYADSASFAATRFGTVNGSRSIALALKGQGHALAVDQFIRETAGRQITGRVVRDSGRYQLIGQHGQGATDLESKGHYWTVWEYTLDGRWRILADTLIGDGRTRADLARGPRR